MPFVIAARVAVSVVSAVLAVLLLPMSPAHGEPERPVGGRIQAVVDRVVPRQLESGQIPGAVVTVVAEGQTVFARGYGVASIDSGAAMDPERTPLYTASVGKLFTATAATQLVRRGELDLHADVNRYLDKFQIPDTYPGRPVTLHHLLTYTSGFDNDVYGWSQWPANELPALADFAEDARPDRIRPPGELVAYNNYDFVLIGRIIENVTGQPFADYVTEHVLDPVGMSSTTYHPTRTDLSPDRVGFYRPDGDGQARTAGHISPATPVGADLVTTGTDMARFMKAQLGGNSTLDRGVTGQMQRQQFTSDPRTPGMGYAFERRPRNGQQVAFKDGDLPGVHHSMALLPESGIGIHIAYNGDGTDGAAFWGGKHLIHQIVDAVVPEVGSGAAPRQTGQETGSVDEYVGNYADTRTSRSNFTAVAGLTGPITVRSGGPGRVTTTGLSENPADAEQEWYQAGPGLFRSEDRTETIAFSDTGALVSSQAPAAAYERLPWHQAPSLHLAVVGAAAVVLAVAFLVVPTRVAIRRRRGSNGERSAGSRASVVLGWLVSASVMLFATLFGIVSADPNRLAQIPLTGDTVLSVALNTVSVVAVLTVAMIAAAIMSWIRRWWSMSARVGYSVLTVAAIAFLAIAINYRLIGLPLTLTV